MKQFMEREDNAFAIKSLWDYEYPHNAICTEYWSKLSNCKLSITDQSGCINKM